MPTEMRELTGKLNLPAPNQRGTNVNETRTRRGQNLLALVMSIGLLQLAVPWSAFAEEAPHLDLGSTQATVTVDASHTETANIQVGDQSLSVGAGSVLTPAQYAAFLQVVNGGQQNLVLGSSGNAVGGHLELGSTLGTNLAGLVVPTNVSLVHDFGGGSPLSIAGNLANSGNFYAVSTNTSVTNAVINAGNVFNNQNALLTSVLPAGGIFGITNAISNLSLTLNVVNDVINAGAITSAANLNINAGGSIVNALPAGVTGVNPIMQAYNNMNLTSQLGSIINSGVMAAMTGNVNIASANNLLINNMGGVIQAHAGNINLRDVMFDAKQDLRLTGGDFLSEVLNANSGTGRLAIDVNSISGVLNATSHEIFAITHSGNLTLGNIVATGDPVFGAAGGDLLLDGSQLTVTGGAPLSLLAAGSVRTTVGGVNIDTSGATGGNIFVAAGVEISGSDLTGYEVRDRRCCGGNIDFSAFPIASLTSAGTAGNAGNITMIAFGGESSTASGPENAISGGGIFLPAGVTINASAAGGSGGNVLLVADGVGSNIASPNSIVTGNINTSGTAAVGTGNVTLATARPVINNPGAPCNPCLNVDATGAVTGTINVGAVRNMSIASGAITTNGGNVTINSGNQFFSTGGISTISNVAGVNSGNVTIGVNSALPFELAAVGGTNRLNGAINTSIGVNGNAGSVQVSNTGTGGVFLLNPANLTVTSGATGNAGNITLNAGTGTLTIDTVSANTLDSTATDGLGGNITLSGERIVATGPNAQVVRTRNVGAVGGGGTISFNQSGTNPITIGNVAGGFRLLAIGTNGGNISVSAPALMNISSTDIFTTSTAPGIGNDGSMTFSTAGSNAAADIRITGNLSTGVGANAGNITINSGSSRSFSINGATAALNGITGNIIASGDGNGKGGNVTITSPGGIDFGAAAVINASGTGTGDGGSVNLSTPSFNGITLDNVGNINVAPGNGKGGSINLTAGSGPLTITNAGTFNLNGNGGNFDGGSFTASVQALAAGTSLSVNANGAGTGKGGSINITTSARNFNGVYGAGSNLSALGGATSGDGGSIFLSSASDLTVTMAGVNASPQAGPGKGATYNFTAGTGGQGNLLVNGQILANGIGAADGGSVTLTSTSSNTFFFGAVTNGINGGFPRIDVSSGVTSGKAGTIVLNALGIGGFGTISNADVQLVSADGAGGSLTVNAPNGNVTFGAGTFDLSGTGAGANSGGVFNITARTITPDAGGVVAFTANGINGGSGGSISITETGDSVNDLTIGGAANQFTLSATGGATDGSGGTISVAASRAIVVVDTTFLSAFAQAGNGSGGTISLNAGTLMPSDIQILANQIVVQGFGTGAGGNVTLNATGNVNVASNILANSIGTGAGGNVTISTGTANFFQVANGPSANGVAGSILASGSQGGKISITNPGGMNIPNIGNLSVAASNGSGGELTFNAAAGDVIIDTLLTSTVDLNAVAANGAGGKFTVNAARLFVTGPNTPLVINANANGTGSGGSLTIINTHPAQDLVINAGVLQFSGMGGAVQGDGGSITLSSGRNLTIDTIVINAAPQAGDSKGSNWTLTAGTAIPGDLLVTGNIEAAGLNNAGGGTVSISSTRNAQVVGSINANGGVGVLNAFNANGGTVSITTRSFRTFEVSALAVLNGVNGNINTSGGTVSGNPGNITITNSGFGGINIADPAFLIANVTQGKGEVITLNAPGGAVSIGNGTINVSGAGTGISAGQTDAGSFIVNALAIIPTGHLSILANGSGNLAFGGKGGTVTLNASGLSSILEIGLGNGRFDIQAQGVGGGGNGGVVALTAGARMVVDPTQINIQTGPFATGGSLSMTVTGQAGGCCGSLLITGPLNFSGAQAPVAVNISVNSTSAFIIGNPTTGNGIQGGVDLSGAGGASGGTLVVANAGTGGVQVTPGTTINLNSGAAASAPTGGTLRINAGSGAFVMTDTAITANGLGECSTGGNIEITAGTLQIGTGVVGATPVQANGGVRGHGGSIIIETTNSLQNLVIGNAPGQFNVSATGGSKGGSVTLKSANNITVNPTFLNVGQVTNPLNPQLDFDHGSVTLQATQAVLVNGALALNGLGVGNGGIITITAGSAVPFTIGAGAFLNGITGALSANSGPNGGNGGAINLNLGTNTSLIVNGGTTLSARSLGVAGAAGGFFNGGTVKVNAGFVQFATPGVLTLNADGAGNGNGGTAELNLTGFQVVNVGGAAGQFALFARGGSVGSTFGDGGKVQIKTQQAINLNDVTLAAAGPLGANGKGGIFNFESTFGQITANAGLSANGVGAGDGGTMTIKTGMIPLNIGAGFGVIGINGAITANAGASGNGGTVRIETGSTMSFQGGSTISAQGGGIRGNGGTIDLKANLYTFQGVAAPVDLLAQSANLPGAVGNGGTISIASTSGPVATGNAGAGVFNINAQGGSATSYAGNGGSLTITSTTLNANMAGIVMGPRGLGGNGAIYNFTTTQQMLITGTINVSAGTDVGNGGTIKLTMNSGVTFGINNGAVFSGITGNLLANSGARGGNGGTIDITNSGSGGISVGAAGTLQVSGGPASSNVAGLIKINTPTGAFTSLAGTIAASGFSKGGTVDINAFSITGPAAGPLTFFASGANGFDAGTVKVKTNAVFLPLTIGTLTGQIRILAEGGGSAFGTTSGGTVDVSSGFDMTVNPAGLLVGSAAANSNGGTIRLAANTANNSNLFINGNLSANGTGFGNGGSITILTKTQTPFTLGVGATVSGVNGTLSAEGGALGGNGGTVEINADSAGATGGITSLVGTPISVLTNRGNGGVIRLIATSSPTTGIQLPITFTVGGTSLQANGTGLGGNGGEVTVSAARIIVPGGGPAELRAQSGVTGNGGTINLRALGSSGSGSDLNIGNGPGRIRLFADGGSFSGNGGTLNLAVSSISNNINVLIGAGFAFGPGGPVGNGGTLTATSGNNFFVNGNLTADAGTAKGDGGSISITTGSVVSVARFNIFAGATINGVAGAISANGSGIGKGGTVTVNAIPVLNFGASVGGFGGIGLGAVQTVFANPGTVGDAGTITLNAGSNGDLNLGTFLAMAADGTGITGKGGTITLTGRNLINAAGINQALTVRGAVNGDGGTINLTANQLNTGNISFNITPGTLSVNITSLGNGFGGTLNVKAGGIANVNANGIVATITGRGGEVNIETGTNNLGGGNIITTGVLNTGFGDKSKLTLKNNFISNSIIQNAGSVFIGRTIELTSQQSIGSAAAPIQIRAGLDAPAGGGFKFTGSSFANAFVNQLVDPVAINGVVAGNQFTFTAPGSTVVVAGTVSATNTLINPALNGNIQINGAITGPAFASTANLTTTGTGTISHFNGLVNPANLNLSSGSGNIGNAGARITSGANNITAATTGSVFLFNTAATTLNASNVGTTLDVLSCGNLTINGTITTPTLILGAFNSDINAGGAVLAGVTTLGISFANNATVNATNPLNLANVTVVNNFNFTSTQAVTVTGAVAANRVNITSGFNQGIAVTTGFIVGSGTNPVITLNAQGNGNITQPDAVTRFGNGLAGTTLVLNSSSGSFGPGGNALRTNVDTLNINSPGAGANVLINEASGVTLGFFNVGNNMQVDAAGPLTFSGGITGGNLILTSIGNLTQALGNSVTTLGNGTVQYTANGGGNITLNGLTFTSGTGTITANATGALTFGTMNTLNGGITLLANGQITQTDFTTASTSTGNIAVTSFGAGVNMGGFLRTNVQGTIGVTALGAGGNITTRGLSSGFNGAAGSNNINVFSNSGSITLPTGSLITVGNNGNITLTAIDAAAGVVNLQGSVFGFQNTSVNVVAGNAITFGSMSVGTGTINLNSLTSTITQTQFTNMSTSTGNITMNANGGAGAIALNGFVRTNLSGDITVNATGNIFTQGLSTGFQGASNNISLNTITSGSITTPAGSLISTGNNGNINLTALGAAGNIALNGSMFTFQTGNITLNAAQSFTQNGGLVSAGTGFATIVAQGGPLNINNFGQVRTLNGALTLTTTNGALGAIVVNGTLTTTLGGAINIGSANLVTLNQFVSSAGGIAITANNGPVTTGIGGIILSSNGNLDIQTVNAANGNITLNAAVQKFVGAGSINITSAQDMSVGSIFASNANINLTANSGTLLVRNFSVLSTNATAGLVGNVTLLQNGTGAADRITTGQGVSIQALASSIPQGNITFSVGGTATPPQAAGTAPGNVSIITSGGGQVFFGPNFNPGITANAPVNTLFAKGANITFFTAAASPLGSNAITLGGSNFLFADPPVPNAPVVVAPQAQNVVGPNFTGGNFMVPVAPTPVTTSPAGGIGSNQLFEPIMPGSDLSGKFVVSPAQAATLPSVNTVVPTSIVQPADVIQTNTVTGVEATGGVVETNMVTTSVTPSSGKVLTGGVEEFSGRKSGNAYVRPAANAVVRSMSDDQIELESGDIVVSAARRSTVSTGAYSVEVNAGTVAMVSRTGAVTKVRGLVDDIGSTVKVMIEGRAVKVGAGEEVIVGPNDGSVNRAVSDDKLGRRSTKHFVIDDTHLLVRSEVSLINLIGKSGLLSSMNRGSALDRSVMDRVMKMAACLFQVTGRRGAYSASVSGNEKPVAVKSMGDAAESNALAVAQR